MAIVSYALEDKLAIIVMDDGKANALSHQMVGELRAALERAEREASAIVLAGRPDRFCGGFDLNVMMSGPEAATELITAGGELLLALYASSIPLVVACTGHALAGGVLVVLTGDHRIGARGAYKLGLNEVSIGLPLPILAMEFARDRLSKRALTQATLLGQIYDAEGALAAGYLDAVVATDEVLGQARSHAARLAALPRAAFRATKMRLRGATIERIRTTMAGDMRDMRTIMKPS